MEAGTTKKGVTVMKRTFALLTTLAFGFGSLAMVPAANAAARHFGQARHYDAVPFVSRFRESPTYAPDGGAPSQLQQSGAPGFSQWIAG